LTMLPRRSVSRQISSACAMRGASCASSCERPKNENFRVLRPRTAIARFSSTLSVGNRFVIWKVRAMPRRARRCGASRVMSAPSNRTRPASGSRIPEIAWNSVVFPAPFGPMTARRSPGSTERSTPSTARSAPNATTTCEMLRMGSDILESALMFFSCQGEDVSTWLRAGRMQLPPPLRGRDGEGYVFDSVEPAPPSWREMTAGIQIRRSALLDPLKVARIGRLLHVGLRIVFPELRHVGVARDRNIPEFSVGTLHHLADIDVVDRVAVSVELDRPSQRRIGQLGGQHRLDQRVAVLDLAADLLDRFGEPHRAGIHGEAVERRDLAVLLRVVLHELLGHRVVGAFGEMRGRDDALAFRPERADH